MKLHPLAVSRLLLLFDYMLFQFSTPAPKLTEQVMYEPMGLLFSAPMLFLPPLYR